jgi:hypothetical protein
VYILARGGRFESHSGTVVILFSSACQASSEMVLRVFHHNFLPDYFHLYIIIHLTNYELASVRTAVFNIFCSFYPDIFPLQLCTHPPQLLVCTSSCTNVRFEGFTAVTVKNVVLWDMKTQFVPHRRHITSPLQSPAG